MVMTTGNEVILVNDKDEVQGYMEKMEAHEKGLLHRAFSVFIFNSKGEMLLQRRALNKYHSGGLWTNACCSHPGKEENIEEAAKRRLMEEMGFDTSLTKIFDFVYKAEFENGLTENEFDHVFVGKFEGEVNYDKKEVMDYCYKKMDDIQESLQQQHGQFTAWFKIAFSQVYNWWKKNYHQ